MPGTESIGRRQCIPIIYTRGTHYEVGFDVGRTFGSLIQELVRCSVPLNEEYLPLYDTDAGRKVYEETLACVNKNFPQYVQELQGTADGAKVPFYKLFLLHMDDITPNVVQNRVNGAPTGCTSICINEPGEEILGHTEDAFAENLNNFYFVSAHIISEKPEGRWQVKEEKFTSLCYAGHLPGYTMSYNHHGFVFSINTLSAKKLNSEKTPRYFITRALLSAENMVQAQQILRDKGCGAADGCSVNMTFMQQDGDRLFHNAELGPAEHNSNESQLNIFTASPGEHIIHTNKYLRLPVAEIDGCIIESSTSRLNTIDNFPKPKTKQDVINILGDQSACTYKVFQDGDPSEVIKTIAVGIFDCVDKTWSIYADNPKTNDPLVVLPLVLKSEN